MAQTKVAVTIQRKERRIDRGGGRLSH